MFKKKIDINKFKESLATKEVKNNLEKLIRNCNECYIHIKTNYYNVFCQKLNDLKLEQLIDFLTELELITEEQKNLLKINKLPDDCKNTLKKDIIDILLEENDNEKKRLSKNIFGEISTICAPKFLNHHCIELRF